MIELLSISLLRSPCVLVHCMRLVVMAKVLVIRRIDFKPLETLLQVTLLPWVCVIGLSLPLLLVAAFSRIPTVGRGIAEVLGLWLRRCCWIGLLAAVRCLRFL